ncbi:4'-phosphopantetheinyl transferase superfamily protein [Streptomyces sp. NPDC035033]|uniref:4'-phosphopantetheinyl transferase family protein n=1 Tax=Streptomyces sp. NPDC035033 TaxID=3155368 RepID=UPI0033CB8D8D
MTRRTGPALAAVATTAEVLARPGLGEELLAPWERRRLDLIRVPGRRDDVLAARLLLRLCAARWTGRPAYELDPAQFCAACGRYGHGRPYLRGHPGTGVSLSHADGLVAVAVGPGAVGVDVEPAARRPGPPGAPARFLTDAEQRAVAAAPDPGRALLRTWVRKEALFKAGVAPPPRGPGPSAPAPPRGPDGPGDRPDRGEGPHVLDWTDEHREAVVTVVSAVPARPLTATDLPSETPL